MNTSDEIKIEQLKALNEKEFQRINNPMVLKEFERKVREIGHHIDFKVSHLKNGVQSFKIFDQEIILRILNYIKYFQVDTQSLFYDKETKLSYLSAIIDFPNKIFNNKLFDNYCIEICQNWFLENGLEFSIDDCDILVSYPNTVETQN
jgi:hypothetical protein